MKTLDKSLKSRVGRLAVLLVVLGTVMGVIAPVDVAQSYVCAFRPVIRTYYSDGTYTNPVGQRGLDCSCNEVSWGVTSGFMKSQTQCCPYFTC